MSDEEIQRQTEQFEIYKQKRELARIGEEKLYDRYTNVKAKEKEEAAILDKYIIDMTQTQKSQVSRTETDSKSKFSLTGSIPGSKDKLTQQTLPVNAPSQSLGMNADQIVLPSSAPAMPGILRKNPMPRKNLHKMVSLPNFF